MSEVLAIVPKFMIVLQKYAKAKLYGKVDINVIKHKEGVTMEILSSNPIVGDMLSDLLVVVAEMTKSKDETVNVQVIDKRGSVI